MKPKFGPLTFLNYFIVGLMGFITLYPFIYVLSSSVTPQTALAHGRVVLWPLGFSLAAYESVLGDNRIITGFINSILYVLAGTSVSVFLTTLTAYALAQKNFQRYASMYMKVVIGTMMFSGGMIPYFLVVSALGFVDSFWVMVIPGAVSPFSLILVRTFMREIPHEMYESAYLDGATDFQIYTRIIFWLSIPIIATISLWTGVSIWNSFTTPMLFLRSPSKYPLQIYLRQILLLSIMQEQMVEEGGMVRPLQNIEALKSATLVVSTFPILIAYPFVQKYFTKGIMVGAIKG
jgi:putative aldouronate transport system permease protein